MKKKLLLTLLVIFLLAGFLIQTASSTNNTVEVLSVNRTIYITYNKIFKVTDQYLFANTGSDPISSLTVEVPYEFSSNLVSFELYEASSGSLSFEKLPYDGSNFIRWRVYLNAPLLPKDTISIRNELVFVEISSDHGSAIDSVYGHIDFHFYEFPSSPYNIERCNVTISCDPSVTLHDATHGGYFSHLLLINNAHVSKNNNTSYDSRYNLTEPQGYTYAISAVEFNYIKREIRVDLWGYLYVNEEHQIKHFGPYGNFKVTSYVIQVPLDAENVFVHDKFGNLVYNVWGDQTKNVTINFAATRYQLQYGENTTYWVSYRLPLSDYSTSNGDKIKLKLNILFGSLRATARNFQISLILPEDASLKSLIPSATSYSLRENSIVIFYNETDVTPYNSKIIDLEFDISNSYGPFFSRPLLLMFILGAVCSSYVIVKRVIPSKERLIERKSVVPTPILLEFCSLNEEKVSIITEIEQLEDDMKKRKIKKRIYRNELKNKEKKILELNKDIEDLKVTLKAAGGRFAQIVNELEIGEAERQSTMDGLYNLEQRYLRKKISIVAYQKLSEDLINRHKRARTKIDKLLFELREILS